LEIFKTFDLNPISLKQKFEKTNFYFSQRPDLNSAQTSLAAQPNSIFIFHF
jgi:hypothetical protein